ncbi:MAG: cupin domain-containing protein [Ornithinimicrobium sp.]
MTGSRPPLADALDLQPHPEGGWFRQTWAAQDVVLLPDGRRRPTATLIYFYLPAGESSAWHRVRSEETWLAHEGTVELELGGTGLQPGTEGLEQVRVGLARTAGEVGQALVPAGTWQRTVPTGHDALVSCLVSPGFHFDDFELAD